MLSDKLSKAQDIVNKYSVGSGATALATGPIPGTSVMLTGIEATMVYHIARVFDFHPTLEEAGISVASLVAASGALKHLAVETSTAIPVIGWWFIKPGIAVATCQAVGKLAIEHYSRRYADIHAV